MLDIIFNTYSKFLNLLTNIKGNKLTKKTISELEKAALTSPSYAYAYAVAFLENRFPEGEKLISGSSFWSYCYAMNVIDGKFIMGEESIYAEPEHLVKYKEIIQK